MIQELTTDLELLHAELPDPLRLKVGLGRFLATSIARKWLSQGEAGAQRLLGFIGAGGEPGLVRVAAILLFQFDRELFYPDFLRDVADYDRPTVEALEPGLWLGRIDEERIVRDLVDVAKQSGNAAILLLLQRPAARAVRDDLRTFLARRERPVSLFAMYAYGYVLAPDDREFLADIITWRDQPELASLAGLYLHKLGFSEARRGIRHGLLAEDRALRESTYSALAGLISAATFERAGYRVSDDPASRERAVEILLEAL